MHRSSKSGRLGVLAALVLSIAACGDADAPGAATTAAEERVFRVDMAKAGVRDLDVTLEAVGTAYASGQVDIRPQISGTLMAAPFVEGQPIEAGQVLAQFDDSKARASLALVEAQLESARAKVSLASERLGRARRLAAEQLVSRDELSSLESEQKATAADVREHEAEVTLARRNLEDYTLRAPIAGRMGIRYVDVGNYVEAGTVLSTLVATDPLEVLFTVPATALGGVEVGQDAEIRDTATRALLGRGRIRVIDARVDTDTRMVSVKALVPNAEQKIKAGQFVGLSLVREHRAAAVVVPEDAVIPQAGKTFVYVVANDRAERREVQLGIRVPELVEVTQGLAAGETIVTRGQHRLVDGAKVAQQTGEQQSGGPADGGAKAASAAANGQPATGATQSPVQDARPGADKPKG